jgi:hypothetical protein
MRLRAKRLAPAMVILEKTTSRMRWRRERFWIKLFGGPDLLNKTGAFAWAKHAHLDNRMVSKASVLIHSNRRDSPPVPTACLSRKEILILDGVVAGHTLEAIGKRIGAHRTRVSSLRDELIKRLRYAMESTGYEHA